MYEAAKQAVEEQRRKVSLGFLSDYWFEKGQLFKFFGNQRTKLSPNFVLPYIYDTHKAEKLYTRMFVKLLKKYIFFEVKLGIHGDYMKLVLHEKGCNYCFNNVSSSFEGIFVGNNLKNCFFFKIFCFKGFYCLLEKLSGTSELLVRIGKNCN